MYIGRSKITKFHPGVGELKMSWKFKPFQFVH